jgi:hypothetical protein
MPRPFDHPVTFCVQYTALGINAVLKQLQTPSSTARRSNSDGTKAAAA